ASKAHSLVHLEFLCKCFEAGPIITITDDEINGVRILRQHSRQYPDDPIVSLVPFPTRQARDGEQHLLPMRAVTIQEARRFWAGAKSWIHRIWQYLDASGVDLNPFE